MEKVHTGLFEHNTSLMNWKIVDALLRRLMDIFASAVGLLLLSPFFFLIMLAVKRDSPGPVFYRGLRAGKNGKPFGILKFRTMYERPDCYSGPRVTASGDQRITPLGKWLRDTKINELPQLWNVLIGDMSLVGPRPEDLELLKRWPVHLREELLSVRPGITSPATVVFREEEKLLRGDRWMDDYLRSVLPNKLRIDALYIRRRNILTDLDVIFLTVLLLMPRIKDSKVPESILFWGPISQFFSRYLNWFILDTLVALVAIGTAGLLWRLDAPLHIGWQLAVLVGMIDGLCFSVFNAMLGLTRVQWARAQASEAFPLAFSTLLSSVFCMIANWALFNSHWITNDNFKGSLPVGMMITASLLAFLGFLTIRYRSRLLMGLASRWMRYRSVQQIIGERVLIVGAGDNSQLAVWLLTHSDLAQAFSIVGIVDDDPRKQGMVFDGFPVVGPTQHIPALVDRLDVGVVLYTITNIKHIDRHRILQLCRRTPAKLILLPDIMAQVRDQFVHANQGMVHAGTAGND